MTANGTSAVLVSLAAVGLAAVHLVAGHVGDFETIPRSEWLSMAGGVSVSYVFVHVLPEIQVASRAVEDAALLPWLEHHVYLLVLVGFVAFYGLEQFVRATGESNRESRPPERNGAGVFWLHVGSFAAYNALIGYLLVHRETQSVESLLLYVVAMALHFVVNDCGLREHHGRAYHDRGRWLLAVAILGGVGIGFLTEVNELLTSSLFAFLAGGIVLNVIKEELPNERRSRFRAFAAGAGGYAVMLLSG